MLKRKMKEIENLLIKNIEEKRNNVVDLIDTHAFTDVVLSGFPSRACPASQETVLIPTFTGGEFPLNQTTWLAGGI